MTPDGRSAAIARVRLLRVGNKTYTFSTSIWSFDFREGATRRLTRWRGDYLILSSYSSDGSTLAASELLLRMRGRGPASVSPL
jgi:hypothetical protein